ncbi:hypothetical protein EJ04DRAFT_513686 [Polyplosphaeria fusca]|uniref:Uncharacterized protein n=1 Tax=Polyplosphaeria fusca TaxID=682080 RepID=A0A9P4QWZ9_9PLEO|nr:hypothetical protein EJ04DRAFT_513686 [Polyplosphaeria fusca]
MKLSNLLIFFVPLLSVLAAVIPQLPVNTDVALQPIPTLNATDLLNRFVHGDWSPETTRSVLDTIDAMQGVAHLALNLTDHVLDLQLKRMSMFKDVRTQEINVLWQKFSLLKERLKVDRATAELKMQANMLQRLHERREL